MRSIILALALLFTVVSGYAEQLQCDAAEFKDNPTLKDACVNLQKALEEKIKEKTEAFSEGINKARSRLSEAKLQQAMSNAPAANTPATGGSMPSSLPTNVPRIPIAPTAPAPNPPAASAPAEQPAAPPQEAPAPTNTPNSNSGNTNIKYY
jgi:hypothetical protein